MKNRNFLTKDKIDNSFVSFIGDEKGSAFLEFSIILPTLAILLVGIMNYGVAWYHWKKMHELVEAITLYMQTPNGEANLSNAQMIGGSSSINGSTITAAVLAANPDLTTAGTPTYIVKCGCPSAGALALSNASTLPPPFCSMPSPTTKTCNGNYYWGTYVIVTITSTYNSIFPAYFQNQNMTVTATVKIY